jgi:hypothetical protein
MKDIVQLNRLSSKCLDVLSSVSKIHDLSKDLVINPNQENIDKLALLVEEFENSNSQISECLMSLLKEIAQEDIEEVDAIETDIGYKL